MLKIPLRLVRPGMRLATAVILESGLVVCPAGTQMDDELRERLQDMEIEAVRVEAKGPWLKDVAACQGCRQEGQRLAGLFRRHGDDPWMRQVRGVMLAYGSLKAAAAEPPSMGDGDIPQEVDA